MHLYGFSTEAERELFLMLIGVQSVGPKVALAVLSGGTPRELLNAIAAGRHGALPGRARASASAPPSASSSSCARRSAGKATDDDRRAPHGSDDPRTLAREGLLGLGFTPQEADRLLDEAAGETPEDLIAERAEGGAMSGIRTPGVERIQRPGAAAGRGRARPLAAPEAARGLRRPGARARSSSRSSSRPPRRAARRSTTCCWPARPASARPRSRRSSPNELDVAVRADRRPGARAQGRRGRAT